MQLIKTSASIDFDGDPVKLVRNAAARGQEDMIQRYAQHKRDYRLSNSALEMTNRDPDMANIFVPKIWSIVRNKYPKDVKALSGVRPYIPFEAKQKDNPYFKIGCKAWEEYIDDLLYLSNWKTKLAFAALLKTVYGTSFIESIPYYNPNTLSYSLTIKVRAPWEILKCNHATGLEEPGQCRYLIAIDVVSKRQVIDLAMRDGYPGVDVEALMEMKTEKPKIFSNEKGQEILRAIGLGNYSWDDDIGVIMRYQSEERYIDIFNDRLVLRDIDNPYPHKLINISRWIHDPDTHTRNQFFGIGECKPNEVMQDLLNGLYEMAIDSWTLGLQPVKLYDPAAMDRASLITAFGNQIPVKRLDPSVPLRNFYEQIQPYELPSSHYNMIESIKGEMDDSAENHDISRGEKSGSGTTAFEIAKLDERGSERQELNIALGEDIMMKSFGHKTIENAIVGAQADDLVNCLGEEKAMYALLFKPNKIGGGYRIVPTGSSRYTGQAIKQRNVDRLFDRFIGQPNTNVGLLMKMYAEAYDVDQDDIEALILPEEVVIQKQIAQALSQQTPQLSGGGNEEPITNQTLQNKNNNEYRSGL